MSDNNQNQVNTPESLDIKNNEKDKRQVKIPEVARKSFSPQPAVPADDAAAIQDVQSGLQDGQTQGQQQASAGNAQTPNPVPVKKAVNDEPYIKAAEKVIEKDKGDPYKEEEDHEEVQIQYLKDRFGKDIKRGK